MSLRQTIVSYLEDKDFAALKELYKKESSVIRHLISLTYDRKKTLCWRAIEAIGIVSSAMNSDEARKLAQRVLWMMREESGGNPWSAPDILGEIVRAHPDALSDIAPIIASFHDEGIFTEGVLKAIGRIAEARPGLSEPFKDIISGYLDDTAPPVRGCAVYAMGRLLAIAAERPGQKGLETIAGESLNDRAELDFYLDGDLKRVTVAELARLTLARNL